MCLHKDVTVYQGIAQDPNVPDYIREGANLVVERNTIFRAGIASAVEASIHAQSPPTEAPETKDADTKAASTTGVKTTWDKTTPAPTYVAQTGYADSPPKLRYRIYSMGNYRPLTTEAFEFRDGDLDWDRSDTIEGPRQPIPGQLYYDTGASAPIKGEDGQPLRDAMVDKVKFGFEKMWEFLQYFGYNSLDNKGIELVACAHIGQLYDNACWHPDPHMMFFGDGSRTKGLQQLERSSTERDLEILRKTWSKGRGTERSDANYDIEILGHELTHGLAQFAAELGNSGWKGVNDFEYKKYAFWAGTLNESIADCFGMMLKQKFNNQSVTQSDWDMAPENYSPLYASKIGWTKNYLRTFRLAPKAERPNKTAPKLMSEVQEIRLGERGTDVHTLMGIPSYAFYLAALAFGGNSWETVGKIWWAALTDDDFKKPENQNLPGWAALTTKHAARLFPTKNGEAILKKAWDTVGANIVSNPYPSRARYQTNILSKTPKYVVLT
jgi:hypothetical protein